MINFVYLNNNRDKANKMTHFFIGDFKYFLDVSSVLSIFGVLFNLMPHIAAIIAAIWVCIRFYDYMVYIRPSIKMGAKIDGDSSGI